MSSVGENSRRKEGPDKLTGVAKYIDDYHLPNCLHGVTLRSTIARGVVKEIRFDPAYNWENVVVVTAKDIPGENYVYLIEVDQPLLVDREVHHAEEPILVLGHEDRAKAYAALAHIEVEYEEWDSVLTMEEALEGKRLLYGSDNVFKRFEIVKGDIGQGVRRRGRYRRARVSRPSSGTGVHREQRDGRVGGRRRHTRDQWARFNAPTTCTKRCCRFFLESPRKCASSRRRRGAALEARKSIRTCLRATPRCSRSKRNAR